MARVWPGTSRLLRRTLGSSMRTRCTSCIGSAARYIFIAHLTTVCHDKLIVVLQEIERTESIKTSCELYKTEFSDGDLMEYMVNLVKITSRTTRFTAVDDEEE